MGAGASVSDLPDRVDEAKAKEILGDKFDEGKWKAAEKDDAGTVSKETFLKAVGTSSKSYVYPPPDDRADDVLCAVGVSFTCRICLWIVQMFDLPVDLCGVDFATQLYSPELLDMNPIHSLPFLLAYKDGKATCINGSEAIIPYLISKYRSKVPDSFFPSDLVAAAQMNEKVAFITNVAYRSTLAQYVYPTMGLMTECQYDICKRDFALDIIENWAKNSGGDFLLGESVTLADLAWYSLWLGNNWIKNMEGKDKLPWTHEGVADKYPNSKKAIDKCASVDAIKAGCDWAVAKGDIQCASINMAIEKGFFGMLKVDNFAKTRTFKLDGDTIHPNQVPYAGDAGAAFNVFEKLVKD